MYIYQTIFRALFVFKKYSKCRAGVRGGLGNFLTWRRESIFLTAKVAKFLRKGTQSKAWFGGFASFAVRKLVFTAKVAEFYAEGRKGKLELGVRSCRRSVFGG